MANIVLAGGCFWGLEEYFQRTEGVLETQVGYANSNIDHPSYEEVCACLLYTSDAADDCCRV